MISITINTHKLAEKINQKNKDYVRLNQESLAKSAIYVQGEVKDSIAGNRPEPKSVDTGRFLNSVGVLIFPNVAKVNSLVDYSKHLEYGTSKMEGRHHFGNSAKRSLPRVLQIFKDNLK